MPRRHLAYASPLLAAAFAGGSCLAAQPFAEVEDRRRAVGDWLVEHVGEEDGGRLVRMTREGDDHNVEYRIGFWRGNAGPVRGGTVMRLNGVCGDYESPVDPAPLPAEAVRAELADRLAACGVAGAQAAATLQGLERAYALVTEWAEAAAAVTAAEAEAVADYGLDMGMDTDMTVTDMNHSAGSEPDPATDLNATDAGDPD